jgi:hypothetical protein
LAEALQMAAPTAGLLFLVDAYDLEAILPLLRAGDKSIIASVVIRF